MSQLVDKNIVYFLEFKDLRLPLQDLLAARFKTDEIVSHFKANFTRIIGELAKLGEESTDSAEPAPEELKPEETQSTNFFYPNQYI